MAQYELTGEAPPPMSVKRPAWGGVRHLRDRRGQAVRRVVTDTQWSVLPPFNEESLGKDPG